MSKRSYPVSQVPASPSSYFEELPRVIDAAYAYWHAHRARVSLPTLIEHGSAELRHAIEFGQPLELDFSTPLGGSTSSTSIDEPEAA